MEPPAEIGTLLLIAFGGVGIIWLLLRWSGGRNRLEIEDIPHFRRLLLDAAPKFQSFEIMLASDRKSGIAVAQDGSSIALVAGLGDKFSIRVLGPSDHAKGRLVEGSAKSALILRIETADMAWPKVDIELYTPPSLNLCLYRDEDQKADRNSIANPRNAPRAIGGVWIKRIEKLASLETQP